MSETQVESLRKKRQMKCNKKECKTDSAIHIGYSENSRGLGVRISAVAVSKGMWATFIRVPSALFLTAKIV